MALSGRLKNSHQDLQHPWPCTPFPASQAASQLVVSYVPLLQVGGSYLATRIGTTPEQGTSYPPTLQKQEGFSQASAWSCSWICTQHANPNRVWPFVFLDIWEGGYRDPWNLHDLEVLCISNRLPWWFTCDLLMLVFILWAPLQSHPLPSFLHRPCMSLLLFLPLAPYSYHQDLLWLVSSWWLRGRRMNILHVLAPYQLFSFLLLLHDSLYIQLQWK